MFRSNFSLADRISIVSDEISEDFTDASLFANRYDIKNFEIRKFMEGRIPDISTSTLRELLDKKTFQLHIYPNKPWFFLNIVFQIKIRLIIKLTKFMSVFI